MVVGRFGDGRLSPAQAPPSPVDPSRCSNVDRGCCPRASRIGCTERRREGARHGDPPKLQSSEAAKAEIERSSPGSAPPPGAPAEQRPLAPIMDAPGVFAASRGRLGQVSVGRRLR